jgi:hypothetical protein
MRAFIYILLALGIFTSCSTDNSATTDKPDTIDSLKQNFNTVFKGVWVLSDYLEAIEKTKSPLKSSDKLEGVVTMIIDKISHADSINIGASWNNHEGYSFTAYFRQGQKPNSLKTNLPDYDEKGYFYELAYENVGNENFLWLYHYNKSKQLVDKKRFVKVATTQTENGVSWGLQYVVNEKLFSGNYLLIDSTNATTKVNFKNDGSLTGYPAFNKYYIMTDFMGGPVAMLDKIIFNIDTDHSKGFAFKKLKDTTYLYSTIGDEDAGETVKLDKIKYKLVHQ